jgi:hypothetical protein
MSSMRVKAPLERNLRLAAGLVMFGFVACHFLSHATGLLGLRLLQLLGHDFILAPWRSPPGLLLLLAAFLTHVTLGLVGLYRRRHLRMPVSASRFPFCSRRMSLTRGSARCFTGWRTPTCASSIVSGSTIRSSI